jgi:hypothetical protein
LGGPLPLAKKLATQTKAKVNEARPSRLPERHSARCHDSKTSPVRRKRRPQRSNSLKDIGRLLGVAGTAHVDRKNKVLVQTVPLVMNRERGVRNRHNKPIVHQCPGGGRLRAYSYLGFSLHLASLPPSVTHWK